MLKKGSKLYSILTGTCPRCHEESMYAESNPYNLGSVLKMNEQCGHCGLKYQIEPSFFYGAMYVSYAVNVALAIAVFVVCFLLHFSVTPMFLTIIAVSVMLYPLTLRLSRNIYINLFVSYEKSVKK
ncbi:MAG TPA: DUF983 domain-containing protein [Flavobacterium sp.]|jgi:uncharacterized protein (DUF983 family)|nr:DUF983 domain-containing protein [Flavobacterium sp.]HPJ10568.1 DUF983 domain-containing protein [Flavobacterium sp.]